MYSELWSFVCFCLEDLPFNFPQRQKHPMWVWTAMCGFTRLTFTLVNGNGYMWDGGGPYYWVRTFLLLMHDSSYNPSSVQDGKGLGGGVTKPVAMMKWVLTWRTFILLECVWTSLLSVSKYRGHYLSVKLSLRKWHMSLQTLHRIWKSSTPLPMLSTFLVKAHWRYRVSLSTTVSTGFLVISAETDCSRRTGQGDNPNSKSNGKPAGECYRLAWKR